ncbi:hypothetical protein BDZ97DRAFT_761680 [Flammula alnicola]|nr:hypothetical protein BDZ97DRAFT_761680 [Flammula alnicola]
MSTSLHLNPFPSFPQGSDNPRRCCCLPFLTRVVSAEVTHVTSCGSLTTRPVRSSEATEMVVDFHCMRVRVGQVRYLAGIYELGQCQAFVSTWKAYDDPPRSLWTRTSADIGVFDSRPYPTSITFRSPLPSSPLSGTYLRLKRHLSQSSTS